jgi:SWI/SNF-related matrix-associated actin-dependent regulator 1 of chromatin subfamily A
MIRGRVVKVRRRDDGTYAVTIGTNGRTVVWMLVDEPLRLGERVELVPEHVNEMKIGTEHTPGNMLIVSGGEIKILAEPFTRRMVAPRWYDVVGASMRRPLFAYQLEGAAWLASRLATGTGAILADEPGLGKTAQSVAAVTALGCFPVLLVCPATLKSSWETELGYSIRDLVVRQVEHEQGDLPSAHVLILNYDLLRAREAQLRNYRFRCMIVDEAHALKEPTPLVTHRAAVATRLAESIRRVALLTGTPMLNAPEELWRQLHIVDPQGWPSYPEFRSTYCLPPPGEPDDEKPMDEASGPRIYNEDDLRVRLDVVMLRRTKTELLKQLPPKRRVAVPVELEGTDRAEYMSAEKSVVDWLVGLGAASLAESAARAEALVRLTMLRHIAARGKLRKAVPTFLAQWVRHRGREPLLIFAFHQDVIAGIVRICRRLAVPTSWIYGRQTAPKRAEHVLAFQSGRAQILVAPLRCGGLGLNLQRSANVLILERLWTPSLMDQAEDRCHRLGQSREVVVHYLDAKRTVDEHVAAVSERKRALIDRVVDHVDETCEAEEQTETLQAVADRLRSSGAADAA